MQNLKILFNLDKDKDAMISQLKKIFLIEKKKKILSRKIGRKLVSIKNSEGGKRITLLTLRNIYEKCNKSQYITENVCS